MWKHFVISFLQEIEYFDYGMFGCSESTIYCPDDGECNIEVYGESGLENGYIHCDESTKCNVLCNELASCQQTVFNGTNTDLLNVKCAQNVLRTQSQRHWIVTLVFSLYSMLLSA